MSKCPVCSLPVEVFEGTYVCPNGHTQFIATDDTNKKSISTFTRNISIKKTKLFPDRNFTALKYYEQFYILYSSLIYRIFRSYYENKDGVLDGFLLILSQPLVIYKKKDVNSYILIIKMCNMALYCAIRFMKESPKPSIPNTDSLEKYIESIQRGSKCGMYTLYEHNKNMKKIRAARYIRAWYSKLTGMGESHYKGKTKFIPREFKSITPYDFIHLVQPINIKRLRVKFSIEECITLYYYDKIVDEYKFLDIPLPISLLEIKSQYLLTVKMYIRKHNLIHHDFTVFCYILVLFKYKKVDINFSIIEKKYPLSNRKMYRDSTRIFHVIRRIFKFKNISEFTHAAYPIFQAYYKMEKYLYDKSIKEDPCTTQH